MEHMKIKRVHQSLYSLPLRASLPGTPKNQTERHGIIVGLESDDGAIGWGDIAPLEGFSIETLSEANAALSAYISELLELDIDRDLLPLKDSVLRSLAQADLFSSLRFGLETALLNLCALRSGVPWHRVLTNKYCDSITVNALANGDHVADDVHECIAQGFRHVKIKIGQLIPERAAEIVTNAVQAGGDRLVLRLDVNGAWNLDTAIRFGGLVQELPIEYIEEPVNSVSGIEEFIKRSAVSVALDESLGVLDHVIKGVYAIIIKPTFRGGISGSLKLADDARCAGAIPIVSSAFESGVAMRALIQLAAVIGDRDMPVGLDTYRRLADDILSPRLDINHPVLDVDEVVSNRVRIRVEGQEHGF